MTRLVSGSETGLVTSPLSQRLARGGLRSLVVAPLQVESACSAC